MSLGIYIHIPFCRHKCNYCDFNSYVSGRDVQNEYVKALCREIMDCNTDAEVDTVYFGGGTPTVLPAEELVLILDAVQKKFKLSENCEISTECNPATINKEGFEILRKGGFNRISMGMQTADDNQLKILGRIHSFEDCRRCVSDCRKAGFENISLDLMSGIPEQNTESWLKSLEAAAELKPQHISCYALRIEEGTPFADMELNIADEDESRKMYDLCVEYLRGKGYDRYEISNFAKKGFESRHNCKYWYYDDFIGFGAGAYSCVEGERLSNVLKTAEYIRRINGGESAVEERIPLNTEDKMSEFVFLGLRMDKGISIKEFEKRFSADIFDVFGEEINKNIKRKTMMQTGDILKISPEFVYVSNTILADFVL